MEKKIIYEMSQSESLIMEYLWNSEDGKGFNEVMDFLTHELGKDWKKQTINTFLKRLTDKGLIEAEQNGKNRVYHAAMTKAEYEKGRAEKFLSDFYDGSFGAFLSALTGGKGIDQEFADELREEVDKAFSDD